MLNSIYKNINKLRIKDYCYDVYKILVDEPIEYEKVSRKKMIDECIKLYKSNPGIINYIYNEEELECLYNLPEVVSSDDYRIINKYSEFFLYCTEDYFCDYTITLELKDVLTEARRIYYSSKEIIEKEKENQYISVGIFRTYGALTPKEYYKILDKLDIDKSNIMLNNYYFMRFVSEDIYNHVRCVFILNNLYGYSEDFIDTHPKDIYLAYNKEQFMDIGCHYFDRKSPHYINAVRHEKISHFLNSNPNEFIIFAGSRLGDRLYFNSYEKLLAELSDSEKNDLFTFFDCLPKYIMNKNQKNILSEEDGNLFYKVMMPFIKYAGNKYGIEFDFNDTRYNGTQANEILNECVKNKFNIVYNYLKDNNLNEEEKEIIKNLKKSIKGPFVILKHLKDGSVFMDSNNKLYLVKGIKSSIDQMDGLRETPTICDTFIFQFKENIIYSSIIIPYNIQIVGNMKNHYMDIYKNQKEKIIRNII